MVLKLSLSGVYHFSFNDVAHDTYIITAGSDFNNDGFICDAGESCGAFMTLDRPTSINLPGYQAGIHFNTSFNINFLSKTTTKVEKLDKKQGYRRKNNPLVHRVKP